MELHWLYFGVLFVAGLAVGSFLNVVVYRLPLDISLLTPPSTCPKCAAPINARDNIPILGYLLLSGKCRACGTPISIRYPLVELATGLMWGFTGWRLASLDLGYWTDIFMGLAGLAFVSAMIAATLIDADHQIIPDEISLGGIPFALLASFALPPLHDADSHLQGLLRSLLGAAVGLAFSLAVYLIGNAAFKKQIEAAQQDDPEIDSALGLGDVKLMVLFGAFLGWQGVIFIFLAASILGSVAGIVMKIHSGTADSPGLSGLAQRWRSGDSVIAFGPFLCIAAVLYYFWGDWIRRLLWEF